MSESSIIQARLLKHASEIEAMENRHRKELRTWKQIAHAEFAVAIIVFAWAIISRNNDWHDTDDAPLMQRVEVITDGFKDKQGAWRSFDNGEPITVKEWRP